MWTSRTAFTAIAVAVLATACGGGGDDGTPVPQGPTLVRISAANQDIVARASVASIMPFLSVPVLSASPSPGRATAAQAGDASAPGAHGGLTQLALRAVDFGSKQLTAAPTGMARPLAQYQTSAPCQVSGSMTVNWDDKDNSGTISGGDVVSMSFSQCSDWAGESVNGYMAMSIATYAETPTTVDLTGSMAFQSLAMVDEQASFAMDGGVSFQINEAQTASGYSMFGSYTVASGGLTVVDRGSASGFSDTFSYRPGYTASDRDFLSAVPGTPSTEEIAARGEFGSQALGGDLSLSMTQPFTSVYTDPDGDIFPSQGQLIATGLDNTKLGLSATQTVQVRMDLCDDGDNAWEASKMVSWDWLLP